MNSTVLIQGETGTGKELIARTIHAHSPRRDQQFVAFNAAAIPESLAEAELFGHVKGAFTGAVNARVGRFELAHRGTLFIDEVAEMSAPLQAKLLRALQERTMERVGDSRSVTFDIRVIAASNVDLKALVKEGKFREDLFYRLNVVPITLPPLRTRRDDIPMLAQHFVRQSYKTNGLSPRTIGQDAMRALMNYSWPGNIRQFENAIEHAVAMSGTASEITVDMLPTELREPGQLGMRSEITIPDEGINFASVVSQLERDLILRCLEKTGGNKRQAARLLQLSRTTLIDKLQRLGGTIARGLTRAWRQSRIASQISSRFNVVSAESRPADVHVAGGQPDPDRRTRRRRVVDFEASSVLLGNPGRQPQPDTLTGRARAPGAAPRRPAGLVRPRRVPGRCRRTGRSSPVPSARTGYGRPSPAGPASAFSTFSSRFRNT